MTSVAITRLRHPLEGQPLRVLGRMRRHGRLELLVVPADGSKTLIPAAWTDLDANDSPHRRPGWAGHGGDAGGRWPIVSVQPISPSHGISDGVSRLALKIGFVIRGPLCQVRSVPPAGLEPATHGLGNQIGYSSSSSSLMFLHFSRGS
jgi:Family of unknown function (DUF5372)